MISARSSGVVSRRLAFRHCVTAASQPTRLNTNTIAGSRPAASSRSTTSNRLGSRGPRAAGRCAAPGPAAALRPRGARRSDVRPRRQSSRAIRISSGFTASDCARAGVRSAGAVGEQVVHPPADQHVLVERHRPALLDDGRGLAAHRLQPLAELLGVGHRRRQRHQRHRLREVDDDLLPDRAAEPVGEVVHLVHHDVAEPGQRRGAGVEHVAQHLGGHHHDRRLAVDGVVAGEQADAVGAVAVDQVGVLLVGQRLDRGRCRSTCGPAASARWTANSPTSVLPDPVGAATSTPRPASSSPAGLAPGRRRARSRRAARSRANTGDRLVAPRPRVALRRATPPRRGTSRHQHLEGLRDAPPRSAAGRRAARRRRTPRCPARRRSPRAPGGARTAGA